MRSRGDRLRCLPCVAHGARPAPALAALVCSPPPLAHQGARPSASLSGWPGAAGNRVARRAVHARHSDALDEPDGASASPGSAHRRQQERSGSPFSASGLVPSGPGSPAAGSARPGVPASTCCIGATECPDPGGSNHGAGDSDWAPDRRLGAHSLWTCPSPSVLPFCRRDPGHRSHWASRRVARAGHGATRSGSGRRR